MTHRPRTVYLDSLGCEKNTVDSESALGLLLGAGYEFRDEPEAADLIVVNTCGFLGSARDESIERLSELGEKKRDGATLVAMGCLVQGGTHDLRSLVPAVDHVLGVGQYDRLAALHGGESTASALAPEHAPYLGAETRGRLGRRHYAHLKIAEGCNQSCSFCKIPLLKGKQRSRPIAAVVAEARGLAESGVAELVLIAQNSSAYGIDLPGQPRLPELCRELAAVDGIEWLRVMYAYPAMFTDRLAEELFSIDEVVDYLDIPVQHASPPVLERMNRGYDVERFTGQIERLRRLRPQMMIRSTALVGFPGETEDDVVALLDFLEQIRFDHLGTFTYSHEVGTPAEPLADDVLAAEKEDRRARVEALQWDVGVRAREAWIGRSLRVRVDRIHDAEDPDGILAVPLEVGEDLRSRWSGEPVAFGRSPGFAPEIDGGVWLPARGVAEGDAVEVVCRASGPYDLFAEPIREGGNR